MFGGEIVELVEKAVRKYFAWAMIATLMLAGGIPLLIFGAVSGKFWLMGIGIAFVAVGFYAVPLLWVGFGTQKGYRRVVYAVNNEHIYTVSQLSLQMSKTHEEMKNTVSKCVEKGYLAGFLFDGENIAKNFNKPHEEPHVFAECEGCGAHYDYPQSQIGVCPYCGRKHQD